jgi:RNase P subunit RPR2
MGTTSSTKSRIAIGSRTVLAASCRKCGKMVQGKTFDYRIRKLRDRVAYIDQRCVNCKWGWRVKGRRDV